MTLIAFDSHSLITDSCNITFSGTAASTLRKQSKIFLLPTKKNACAAFAPSGDGNEESENFKEMLSDMFFLALAGSLIKGQIKCPVLLKVPLAKALEALSLSDTNVLRSAECSYIGITNELVILKNNEDIKALPANHQPISMATGEDYQLMRASGMHIQEAFDAMVGLEPTISPPMQQVFMDELQDITYKHVQAVLAKTLVSNCGILGSSFKQLCSDTIAQTLKDSKKKETL